MYNEIKKEINMLTHQTYKLLKSLRTFKLPYIIENLDDGLAYRVVERNELDFRSGSLLPTYNQDNFIIARVDELEYLQTESYLTIKGQDIKLLHKGYKSFQISLIDFGKFLGKSVVTPIVVSFITAFLTVLFFK